MKGEGLSPEEMRRFLDLTVYGYILCDIQNVNESEEADQNREELGDLYDKANDDQRTCYEDVCTAICKRWLRKDCYPKEEV